MSMLKSVLVFAAGVAVAALVMVFLYKGGETGKAAGTAPPAIAGAGAALEVPVTQVVKKTVPVYLEYVGTTDAIRTVTLQAQVIGYLLKRVVPDGSDVEKGALLYQIDPRNYQAALDQAKAQAEKDSAALEYAQANHRRNSLMSTTGDVSIDTLQQSASAEHQGNATLAVDRAAIETAQINLGYTEMRAPFAGRLSLSVVNEGALISVAGTQLNTLVQLDPIYATFNPPDTDLPQIQKYQAKGAIPAEIIVGDGSTPQYRGALTFLDNNVGRSTGTITARATIANPSHALLPGQFIRVRLHVADQPDTLLLPQVGVGSSQLGSYVYVVGQGGKVEQRFVTLGADYDPLVAVSKGVSEGESVVVGNLLKIGPGSVVKPVPATPAPATPASAGPSGGK
jgi:membrane fusion protein, multidrug efflux system